MKRSKRLRDIYNHFGDKTQREKLYEEINEYLESGELEELADIWVVITQIYLNDKSLRDLVDYKITRTEKRIKSGYYNVDKKISK